MSTVPCVAPARWTWATSTTFGRCRRHFVTSTMTTSTSTSQTWGRTRRRRSRTSRRSLLLGLASSSSASHWRLETVDPQILDFVILDLPPDYFFPGMLIRISEIGAKIGLLPIIEKTHLEQFFLIFKKMQFLMRFNFFCQSQSLIEISAVAASGWKVQICVGRMQWCSCFQFNRWLLNYSLEGKRKREY